MFLPVPAYPGSPGQKAVKRLCVYVCVCVCVCVFRCRITQVERFLAGRADGRILLVALGAV